MNGAFDPLLVWMAVACLASLFAHAALAKWSDRALFEQHLAALRAPSGWLTPLSFALPALEAAAAVLLLTPWRTAGAALAAALLLMYAGVMAWHRAQGRTPDCGCGGEPLPISWALVARNAALAALAAVAGSHAAPRALGLADFAVIVAGLLLATLLHAALHQVLRHRAGLRRHATLRRT